MTTARAIASALAAMGLRIVRVDERGWYVFVLVGGVSRRVWATDGRGT